MKLLLIFFALICHAAARPNIVFIVADDLGYGELGSYGGTEIPTPHIDSIAKAGARFEQGYVTSPFCAASRAALLTGRYQTSFGFENNPIKAKNMEPGIGLPVEQETIADRLRNTGYSTAIIGKWHLGGTAPFHPQRRGFDEFFGFLNEGHYYVPPPWKGVTTWLRREALPDGGEGRWTSPDGKIIWSTHMGNSEHEYDTNNPILRQSQPVDESENLTDAFARESIDFIERHKTQPFFLYLSYSAVHSPLQAPDEYLEKFAHIPDIQRRIFAGLLSHMDDSIGKVLASIKEQGLEENTIVVFLSDNGGPTAELTSSNAPLRGGKGQLYEGGIRVPFAISWKGKIPADQTIQTPIISIDLAATIYNLLEIEDSGTQGIDIMPLLMEGDSEDEINDPSNSRSFYWRMSKRSAMRDSDWKIVRERKSDWELFDLRKDLSESKDLSKDNPKKLAELIEKWTAWSDKQAKPLW